MCSVRKGGTWFAERSPVTNDSDVQDSQKLGRSGPFEPHPIISEPESCQFGFGFGEKFQNKD
eukprot:1695531-Pyramimonas_sp.AAC.2